MSDFDRVVPALAHSLAAKGYSELTPVQKAVLEPEAEGRDLLVSAQTGSGKTVAFGLALAPTLLAGAERFGKAAAPLALIVAPTRELAMQVRQEFAWLYEPTGARILSCVGGMDMRQERAALANGGHVVVGTPGRLRDHIERGTLDLSDLRAVVLDEADEMLDLGFREDLEFILDAAPEDRRTLLFSATVAKPIAALAKRFQRDALRISTARESEQHGDIDYRALTVAPTDRENAIINVLRYHEAQSALVFCATREAVKHLAARLGNRGFSVVALSGELSQQERTHALQTMRDGRARVCVATDVAARGIDLPNLELVIHADLPVNREALLHRSGRTGRAGRKGTCVLVVPHTKRIAAERLLRNGNISAHWSPPPGAADVTRRDHERLLDHASLHDAPTGDEVAFARELLTRHSAERVAVAYLRQQRANQPAPEELVDPPAAPAERKQRRDDFTDSVWFKVSVGHKQNAEARWLLPMICRAGHITRRDVGSIKIMDAETHFEIATPAAARFIDAVQRGGTGDRNATITPLNDAAPARPRDDKPRHDERRPEAKLHGGKPHGGKPHGRKQDWRDRPKGRPGDDRPKGHTGGKPGDRPIKRKMKG
jgi:ATP-dependent RNA helicase DeaD